MEADGGLVPARDLCLPHRPRGLPGGRHRPARGRGGLLTYTPICSRNKRFSFAIGLLPDLKIYLNTAILRRETTTLDSSQKTH